MNTFKNYFFWSTIFTVICLSIGFVVGYLTNGVAWWLSTLFIVAVLGILETCISFDNAIVNVNVLKEMDSIRQKRFLTRWMIIAVFGMRVLFPIILVAIFAKINPLAALQLAIYNPVQYGHILQDSHLVIAWFGWAFLMMVGLKFFFNKEKNIHRVQKLEKGMTKLGQMEAIEAAVVLLILELVSYGIDPIHAHEFFVAGVRGVVLYILINGIEALFGHGTHGVNMVAKTGLASFLYLEILDASFSLDGVIGAFALSNNLLVIACGLGIGAYFVRSFTVYMMKHWTLESYRYLEHGAFYAIIALACTMLFGSFVHLPEVVIWLIGAVCIWLSLYSSWKENKKNV